MWLLEADALSRIETADYPTAEQEERHALDFDSDVMSIAGTTAQVNIEGVLTDRPSFMAMFFGGGNTTYNSIRAAIAAADTNPAITDITLAIDSPGGQAGAEWFATMDAIAEANKPVTARVSGMAASAAYGIASQADSIIAQNPMTRVGSIGVVARIFRDDSTITVRSTQAPDKVPDPESRAGVRVIRKDLDAIHDLFAQMVARGRGRKKDEVNRRFGRGATLLAADALSRGMIDSIATVTAQNDNDDEEKKAMTLTELSAEFPDLHAQALQLGVDKERDRVSAHLIMAEQSGDMKTAVEAINDGSEMTATIQAKYMSAALNKRDIDARISDDPAVVPPGVSDPLDQDDQIVAMIEKKLGIENG